MRTGTATPKTANTPRFRGENRKPRSTTSRANPFASTNLFGITSVGVRGPATATRAGGDGGGGRWGVGAVDGRFGGRRGRAVRSRARPRGGRVGGRRGGRARAGRELSGAGGGAGRTLARSWTRCADAGRSDAARAGAARDGATRYRARARAVLQVEIQSREKMEHLPICVSSVRTLSRASSGRGRHFGYCRRCLLSRRAATSFLVESNDLRRPLA